jgi:hemoglobin
VVDPEFFDRAGGVDMFTRLVARFYEGVAEDPVLRPLYPEQDLEPAAERLTLFLIQYWGGPGTYSATRGHPRLRMRHAPFVIGEAERDAWLRHMQVALAEMQLDADIASRMWDYFVMAADSMRNSRT